jgi:hypothetical protein
MKKGTRLIAILLLSLSGCSKSAVPDPKDKVTSDGSYDSASASYLIKKTETIDEGDRTFTLSYDSAKSVYTLKGDYARRYDSARLDYNFTNVFNWGSYKKGTFALQYHDAYNTITGDILPNTFNDDGTIGEDLGFVTFEHQYWGTDDSEKVDLESTDKMTVALYNLAVAYFFGPAGLYPGVN